MNKSQRLLEMLNEEWVTGIERSRGAETFYYEIFKNPKPSEIKDLLDQSRYYKGARFLADPKRKEVYVWSSDVLHSKVFEHMGYSVSFAYGKFWAGTSDYFSGKFLVNKEELVKRVAKGLLDGDYDFMERYGFDLSLVKEEWWLDKFL